MEKEIIIDGENAILGRLASYTSKELLKGKEIIIINADKVIITGRKEEIVEKYLKLMKKGGSSLKGPRIIRSSERILKRVIRGMLPHKKGRGSDALKRVRCYNDIPEEYKEKKKIKSGKVKTTRFITLKELAKRLKE